MWSINPTSFSWLPYRMQPDERRLTARVVLVQYLSQDIYCIGPDLTLLGKLRSTWASSAVNVIHPISLCLCCFLSTIGCSSPLRCADLRILLLKCQGLSSLLPLFYHLGIFQHLFYPIIPLLAFCSYAPRPVCPAAALEFQRRRLDPSCFPTRCLLGKLFNYYASSPTPPAPPTSSISYLPVFDLPQPEKTSTESVCQSPANDATVVPPSAPPSG